MPIIGHGQLPDHILPVAAMARLPLTPIRVVPTGILLAYHVPHFYAVSSLVHRMGLAPEQPRRGRHIVIYAKILARYQRSK